MTVPLGSSVPPHTPHAISVSLPTWKDNVGYEEGEKRVVDSMVSGYPRFFIHLLIQKLARVMEHKHARPNESCMLFPSQRVAEECRSFMSQRSAVEQPNDPPLQPRLLSLLICPEDKQSSSEKETLDATGINLYIVFFPSTAFSIAKQFWQHTGMGISSRLAERCLKMLPGDIVRASETTNSNPTLSSPTQPSPIPKFLGKSHNRHYSVGTKGSSTSPFKSPPSSTIGTPVAKAQEQFESDHTIYLEERYGRNLPLSLAESAKRALRRRIAGVLVRDPAASSSSPTFTSTTIEDEPTAGSLSIELGPSSRGVQGLTEHDVYLYQTGMSAIWNAHALIRSVYPTVAAQKKSVCFGFPYTDTLKILEKWSKVGCLFYGNGVDEDLDELERYLEEEKRKDESRNPPLLALFTEFPSNPLLKAADLPRLRGLADKYGFLIVVDETIGNFVNVGVLQYADVVVSSLSKVFSGVGNVMGGSLVLNPQSRHYPLLKSYLNNNFEDIYFNEDAIYIERNSRDFVRRIKLIDENAEAICDFLRSRSLAASATDGNSTNPNTAIKEVFYPKFITSKNYNQCRLGSSSGYGGLFSLTFVSSAASQAFFDTLPTMKGPSLGSNFTLACPYTVLAHFGEFDWARGWGVEEGLVRVSVGCEEERAWLLDGVKKAAEAAEEAVKVEREGKP